MSGTCTVLAIEDDPHFRLTLTDCLEDSGDTVLKQCGALI